MMKTTIEKIKPGTFQSEKHFYSKVLNAQIHPIVSHFFTLKHTQIISRYCHLNPQVKKERLKKLMQYQPKYFKWAGSDLFHVTTNTGERKMLLIETNSCPSGQKSMPLFADHKELGGYRYLLEKSFIPLLSNKNLPSGSLAVLYDKNYMEASGYAAALAEITQEQVYLVPVYDEGKEHITWKKGVLYVNLEKRFSKPIRAAFRYVTQKPWNRIPISTKTLIYNPIIACLAGGRNKMVASKAYDLFNTKIKSAGLRILIPETINDVSKNEIPLWVQKFNGMAVIKIPYSNAGQGVFTITNKKELATFMKKDYEYDQFVVQNLIGNSKWSSEYQKNKYYHVGTIPNKQGKLYAADLRMMIISTPEGLLPVSIYARRAKDALPEKLSSKDSSWDILGTNLSIKEGENQWSSDTNRLLIMDRRDFNSLGLGIDNLIEAYIQTILSVIAIDQMAQRLIKGSSQFKEKLFTSLNNDSALIDEIREGQK